MCRTKMATNAAQPTPKPSSNPPPSPPPQTPHPLSYASEPSIGDSSSSTSKNFYYNSTNTASLGSGATATLGSSAASLASLRGSLPENPTVFDISEIRAATNNFLARRHSVSSSAPCWRCSLRGKDALVFQRKFHRPTSPAVLRHHLSLICKSHHVTIVKLLGASLSGGYVFLVYEYVPGVNLADSLRNPNNPSFTVLSSWMSRIKIATDLANALDYIHNSTGLSSNLVHNHVKSRSVLVSDPSLTARICHFGTSILCGEIEIDTDTAADELLKSGDVESNNTQSTEEKRIKLGRSRSERFEGTNGYMSPEFKETGVGTQMSDVYAFGVVLLELVSGEEAVRYTYEKAKREYVRRGVVEVAREVVEEGEGRVRRWVDRRLGDSFPVQVAERLTRVALECVREEAERRPNMRRVAGKISKLYLESQNWADRIQPPPDLTVSFGPR